MRDVNDLFKRPKQEYSPLNTSTEARTSGLDKLAWTFEKDYTIDLFQIGEVLERGPIRFERYSVFHMQILLENQS